MNDILTLNERQTLVMILPSLSGGYKAHASELIDNSDPTGGLVSIDDQVVTLYRQYVATWSRDYDL